MSNNYNVLKAYNSFIKQLKRGDVKSSQKLASHIFDRFFSLTSEPKNAIFQLTKDMYFEDQVGFEIWRKKIIKLKVVELVHRKKQFHRLGSMSMKYLNDAFQEQNFFPNPLEMMNRIKKLEYETRQLKKETAALNDWKIQVEYQLPQSKLILIRGGM